MNRKPETIAFWRGRLPHWEVEDGRYFVTIHVAGAIPKQGHERIHAIAAELERVKRHHDAQRLQIQRRIFAEMEAWLDRATRVDYLRQPEIAEMIIAAIEHRKQRDWYMYEFVVMPSHVHLFFETGGTKPSNQASVQSLKLILEQFKRWTGHEAGKLLPLDGSRFWQDEWFDHWSRSDEEDEKIMAYIRRNPERAGLAQNYIDWPYGSWKAQ